MPPPRPNQVASRSGAVEKPVMLSTVSRIIRGSEYFEVPPARGARG